MSLKIPDFYMKSGIFFDTPSVEADFITL